MKNQLLKVITDSKVEQSTALSLQNAFLPFYDNLLSWSEKAKTLVVTDASQVREMKMAREGRLALRDIRVAANKKRIALKEDSTRYGKAVQNVYNLIDDLCTPAEKHLEEQEKFVEIQEENRKAELKAIRTAELLPYAEFVDHSLFNELGEYSEVEYQKVLSNCKDAMEYALAEEAQAELDRIAKEQEKVEFDKRKVERQEKLFELGCKWDGSIFKYKTLRFGQEIMEMSPESFEMVISAAKVEKDRIDLEDEQALARMDRKGQPVSPVVETIIPSVMPTPSPVYRAPEVNKVNHSFHCFLCGAKLSEIGLGGLECDDCLTVFIPFLDQDGNQCLASQK